MHQISTNLSEKVGKEAEARLGLARVEHHLDGTIAARAALVPILVPRTSADYADGRNNFSRRANLLAEDSSVRAQVHVAAASLW